MYSFYRNNQAMMCGVIFSFTTGASNESTDECGEVGFLPLKVVVAVLELVWLFRPDGARA